MTKHILFLILAVLVLAACGGQANDTQKPLDPEPQEAENATENAAANAPAPAAPDTNESAEPAEAEPQTEREFFFKIDDVEVELNRNVTQVINRLGEPLGVLELPSCAFEGMDRVFRYPGADLYTYPVGDDDFVYTIVFFDDSVRTAEGGIRLGSDIQAVFDAYGDDYKFDSGMYTFTRGLTTLEFFVEGSTVMGIAYAFMV